MPVSGETYPTLRNWDKILRVNTIVRSFAVKTVSPNAHILKCGNIWSAKNQTFGDEAESVVRESKLEEKRRTESVWWFLDEWREGWWKDSRRESVAVLVQHQFVLKVQSSTLPTASSCSLSARLLPWQHSHSLNCTLIGVEAGEALCVWR